MEKRDLIAFADPRRWEAVEKMTTAHWLARKRELGPIDGIRQAAQLWGLVQRLRPDWPTAADRAADLETHRRVSEGLGSVAATSSS
jgi:hypothetical protein